MGDAPLYQRDILTIADVEAQAQLRRTALDRASDAVSAFAGSVTFVAMHVLWFAVWIGMHVAGWAPDRD